MNETKHRLTPRASDAGSVYLVAVIVLFVLTLVGVSLSLVTQAERQLGDNDRIGQRVFYAAEAGFSPAIPRVVVEADYGAQTFSIRELNGPGAALELRSLVNVSPFQPILAAPCDLCEVGNAGTYNNKNFYEVTHALTTHAERVGKIPGSSGALAQKTLSLMVDIMPIEDLAEAHVALMNPEQIAKLRF